MTREEFDSLYYGKVVCCDTYEKAKEFLVLADSVGYRWHTGDKATDYTRWEDDREETCYLIGYANLKDVIILGSDNKRREIVEFNKKESDKDSRNKINDYNIKMLEALHAVFWYEGLLEQDKDEWVDFKKSNDEYAFSRPKYAENCFLVMFIKTLKEHNGFFTFTDVEKISDGFQWKTRHTVIWQMLVEMFGSCGTSPRTGWIEQNKECADFLEQIVCIEELVYDNTNRIKGN